MDTPTPTYSDAYLEIRGVLAWGRFQMHTSGTLYDSGSSWVADLKGHLLVEAARFLTGARGFTELNGRKEDSIKLVHKALFLKAEVEGFKAGSDYRTRVKISPK